MNSRISRLSIGAVIGLLSVVIASHTAATPITSGRVSLEFKSPPTPTTAWELAIDAWYMAPCEDGRIELLLVNADGHEARRDLLWEGEVNQGDSMSFDHILPVPTPGMYSLGARFIPFPGRKSTGGAASIAYVLVTEDTVFLAWSGFRPLMLQQLNLDMVRRGLGDISPKELKFRAPDLAERWLRLHGMEGLIQMGGRPKPDSIRDSLIRTPHRSESSATTIEQDAPASLSPDSQETQFLNPDSLWPGWSAQQRQVPLTACHDLGAC